MTPGDDCNASLRANLRRLDRWNAFLIALAVLSLVILGGACVALYHFPK